MKRVIKIGTSTTLTAAGLVDAEALSHIADGIKALLTQGDNLVVVTSGAVGAGRGILGPHHARPALAAVGQMALTEAYGRALSPVSAAQLLVDQSHLTQPCAVMALQTVLHHLWRAGTVPLVNENDALSGAGHRIGDNDTLAAMLAGLIDADQLIILSDIDGLYSDNPATNPLATRIALVPRVSPEHFLQFGEGRPGPWGSGGIVSKLKAAHIAQGFGIETILAPGRDNGVFDQLLAQQYDNFTRFLAQQEA